MEAQQTSEIPAEEMANKIAGHADDATVSRVSETGFLINFNQNRISRVCSLRFLQDSEWHISSVTNNHDGSMTVEFRNY